MEQLRLSTLYLKGLQKRKNTCGAETIIIKTKNMYSHNCDFDDYFSCYSAYFCLFSVDMELARFNPWFKDFT